MPLAFKWPDHSQCGGSSNQLSGRTSQRPRLGRHPSPPHYPYLSCASPRPAIRRVWWWTWCRFNGSQKSKQKMAKKKEKKLKTKKIHKIWAFLNCRSCEILVIWWFGDFFLTLLVLKPKVVLMLISWYSLFICWRLALLLAFIFNYVN